MKKVIKNNYKIIIGFTIGLIFSITTVYAVEAYIESNKVSYDNHNKKITAKDNVQDAIDELYEKSGIHNEKWTDPTLNGADPVLKDPLIPVTIDNNGNVYYANLNSEWYNYSEKRWANAVILVDNPSNKNYEVGMQIKEDDIESYFVWVPRFRYKIWNLANTSDYTGYINANSLTNNDYNTSSTQLLNKDRIIDIEIGDTNKISKMNESEAKLNEYYTHPAFTLGNKDLNGIWVGKFETGGTSKDNMVVKPDVYSWRNETVKTFFDASKSYRAELDSHMMKNTEWGAVAYFSHSQYGIGTEVNINNAKDYKTGYSAAPNTDQSTRPSENAESSDGTITQPWNTEIGYLASTTGNITGIYDMSGGSWEAVAACVEGATGSSGFDATALANEMATGYIDKYATDSSTNTFNKRILGDATGEMGPFYYYMDGDDYARTHNSWYGDCSVFVRSDVPWFYRSGDYLDGGLAGQFYFIRSSGGKLTDGSFRIILSIK